MIDMMMSPLLNYVNSDLEITSSILIPSISVKTHPIHTYYCRKARGVLGTFSDKTHNLDLCLCFYDLCLCDIRHR